MSELEGRPDLVKKRSRAIRVAWLFWVSMFALVAIVLGTLFFNALASIATREALLDCTTPDGECYKRGLETQAKVVKQLITAGTDDEVATRRIVVLAAICAETIDNATALDIQRCIDRRMLDEQE